MGVFEGRGWNKIIWGGGIEMGYLRFEGQKGVNWGGGLKRRGLFEESEENRVILKGRG